MTPQEIRSKFEHGAPDRFLAFYYAVLAVVGDEAWAKNNAALTGGLDG